MGKVKQFLTEHSHLLGTAASVLAISIVFNLVELPSINKYNAAKNKKPIFDKIGNKQEQNQFLSLSSREYDLVVVEMKSSITSNKNIFIAKRVPTYSPVTGELTVVSYYEIFTGKLLFESGDSKDNIHSDELLTITDLIFLLDEDQIGQDITIEQAIEIYNKIKNEYSQTQTNYGRK